jgi:hypothetical protein
MQFLSLARAQTNFHSRSSRVTCFFSLALLASSACVTGCVDDAALSQREATKKFHTTVAAAEKAMASVSAHDPEANRTSAESLRQVAASATPAAGSSAAQKSSLSLIASQLQIQAARLDTVAIETLEKTRRLNADNVLVASSLSLQFQALEKSTTMQVPPEAREVLEKDRAASEIVIKALAAQSEKQKEAVDQTASTIAENQSKALELEKQAHDLKQQAIATGPIGGLKLTIESQKSMTDSRKLHSQSANLDLDSQTAALEHRISIQTGDAYEASVKRNEASMGAIADIEALREASMKEFTRLATDYKTSALDSAKALRESSEKVNALYDGAIEGLEKAVSLAQQASSGDSSKNAKLPLVSAQLALAGMLERRESASTLDISAYTAAGKIDADGSWSKDAAAAQAIRQAAKAKAVETFEAVLNGIPEGSADDNVVKFRKGIEVASAHLTGGKAKSPDSATQTDAPTDDAAKSEGNSDAPKSEEPAIDATTSSEPKTEQPAADPAAADPASAPPADPSADPASAPPADPAATDPASAPPADPAATDPASSPPADPPANDPASAPPADPPASDPANAPPADPPASDPASEPPADPPASDPASDPPAAPPA